MWRFKLTLTNGRLQKGSAVLRHTRRHMSPEVCDERRHPNVDMKGLVRDRLLYYTAVFIRAAPPRLHRGQMGADTEAAAAY